MQVLQESKTGSPRSLRYVENMFDIFLVFLYNFLKILESKFYWIPIFCHESKVLKKFQKYQKCFLRISETLETHFQIPKAPTFDFPTISRNVKIDSFHWSSIFFIKIMQKHKQSSENAKNQFVGTHVYGELKNNFFNFLQALPDS